MHTKQLMIGLAGSALLATGAQAAFIVEANNGLATATNFSFGGDTTSASASSSSAAVGLSGTGTSLFGGNGNASPDTYVFSYTPGTDVDNFSPTAGSLLGSTTGFGTETASGLAGGVSGTYNVYLTSVQTTNISGGATVTTVNGDGAPVVSNLDLNNGGTGADLDPGPAFVGGANESWLLIGTVDLTAGNTYTVTLEAGANTFVSMRAQAVMWELVPEPGSLALLGLGGLAVLRRRR